MPDVTSPRPRPLHFAAFVMNTTGHIIQGTWRRPSALQTNFNDLEHWVNLAKLLERGKFDAIFFADVVGLYAPYRGDERKYFEAGLQVPSNDPSVLASALAYVSVAARDTADIRARAVAHGRHPDDLKFFQGLFVLPASTEAEAKRKSEELDEWIDWDGQISHMSGAIGIDFGFDDLDTPIGKIQTEGVQSAVGWIKDLVPGRPATLRDVARLTASNVRIVGTPEQIADTLATWQAAGVDGVNLINAEIPGTYEDFVEHVAPVLQRRGLMQSQYAPGTFRNKLFGRGDRLPDRHPAARYRGAFAPRHAAGATR